MARFPQLNPLLYVEAVCSQCGLIMEREIERGPMGRVQKIIYRCQNADMGCDYQVESDQRLNGMCAPISEATRAGK